MKEAVILGAAILAGSLALVIALQVREERRHRQRLERYRRSLHREEQPWTRY